jgi:phosphoribosylanthranilate isomerase
MSRVRVKICGLRTVDDMRAAVDAGADAIGFNLHPPSPRHIDPHEAKHIINAMPPYVEPVGVVVNSRVDSLGDLASAFGFASVQWHGDALPAVGPTLIPAVFVPAVRVRAADDLALIREFVSRTHACRAVLVDAHVPGEYGGTGQTAPWHLLAGFNPGVPLILAGGLTPENVAGAIRIVRPYAVDVASGVESSPGVKDADKMRRFVAAVRSAV